MCSMSSDELDVGSPFDYRSSGLLYCAKSLPNPNRPGRDRGAHQQIARMATAAGGRTLALFTSYDAMDRAAEAVTPASATSARSGSAAAAPIPGGDAHHQHPPAVEPEPIGQRHCANSSSSILEQRSPATDARRPRRTTIVETRLRSPA